VADSGVVNVEWENARFDQGTCPDKARSPALLAAVQARTQFQLADIKNEPDKLVSRGELSVPMGAADCAHEPLRAAIAGLGPGSRSRNLRVCVTPAGGTACATHVVTTKNGTNTDPAEPADYNGAILDWVHARLGD
jgi:hypothetical protein